MARVKHLNGGHLFVTVMFGLLLGVLLVWVVWYIVRRLSLAVLRHKSATLPWRKVLPVMYGMLLICFAISSCVGALLTRLLIKFLT